MEYIANMYKLRKTSLLSGDIWTSLVSLTIASSALIHGYLSLSTQMIISDLNFKESISNNIIGFDVWFSGLFYTSEIIGSFYSYKISDNYGRRPTLLFFSAFVAAFVSWSSATNSAFNLLITRAFVGFGIGILLSTSIVYLAEIALKSQRGKLISFIPLMITCGNGFAVLLYEMTRRQSDNWRTCLLFPVLVTLWLLLGLSLIPESPRWLLAHKSPPGNYTTIDYY
jgi:MFS family permease